MNTRYPTPGGHRSDEGDSEVLVLIVLILSTLTTLKTPHVFTTFCTDNCQNIGRLHPPRETFAVKKDRTCMPKTLGTKPCDYDRESSTIITLSYWIGNSIF